jgi:UDP-N-acetylmuramate--alanine ligase
VAEGPVSAPESSGERLDLSGPRSIHLIGAGGTGMSAIGTVLVGMGHRVSGSDTVDSRSLRRLEDLGAVVHVGHAADNLGDSQVVARSTAIAESNVEVLEAQRRSLRVWRRSEILAAICAQRRVIAVGGTHGKTTTSSMLYLVLRDAGLHPSAVIGGEFGGLASGAAWDPAGHWMVVEADESDGTFLQLGAEAAIVTSVEPDHLDYFGDAAGVQRAFEQFVDAVPGALVLCADDAGAAVLANRRSGTASPVVAYGTSIGASVRIVDPRLGGDQASFTLEVQGSSPLSVSIGVPGLHNVRNAAAAMAMAHCLGVSWEDSRAIESYSGVARRMQRRGTFEGAVFVDDYGHLPSEVGAAISAARDGNWERVIVVFQPHRYSRTRDQWPAFADAFVGADVLVVTDVYSAGEPALPGISGRLIFDAVARAHPDAEVRYIPALVDVAKHLRATLADGDLCLTLGAGDVTGLADLVGASGEGDNAS